MASPARSTGSICQPVRKEVMRVCSRQGFDCIAGAVYSLTYIVERNITTPCPIELSKPLQRRFWRSGDSEFFHHSLNLTIQKFQIKTIPNDTYFMKFWRV